MPPAVLLDTHVFVWGQLEPSSLTPRAKAAIEASPSIFVSAITFFEIAQKARLGKWPEVVPALRGLPKLHQRQGGQIASVDADIALTAGEINWLHRDPFDCLIAATAIRRKMWLVSADAAFDEVVERVW